jgi:hypothetical protein
MTKIHTVVLLWGNMQDLLTQEGKKTQFTYCTSYKKDNSLYMVYFLCARKILKNFGLPDCLENQAFPFMKAHFYIQKILSDA